MSHNTFELFKKQGLFATPDTMEDLMSHPLVKANHDMGTVTCTMMMYNLMATQINEVITLLNSSQEELKKVRNLLTKKNGSLH